MLLDRTHVAGRRTAPRTVVPVRGRRRRDAAGPRTSLGVLPLENRFLTWGSRVAAARAVVGDRGAAAADPGARGGSWWSAAVCNVVLLAVGTLVIGNRVAMADRVAQWLFSAGALIVFSALSTVLFFVFIRGWAALHHWNFFTQTMQTTLPDAPFDQGGVLQSIVGTLIELGIAIAITLPLGVGHGGLHERGRRQASRG